VAAGDYNQKNMPKFFSLLLISLLFVIGLSLQFSAYGAASAHMRQTTTGTLIGMILDENGQPLQGALVKVTNVDNGFPYSVLTDENGFYTIELLPAGEYDITAAREGYQSKTLPRYPVDVGERKIVQPPPIRLTPISAPPTPTPLPNLPTSSAQANISDATLRGNAPADFISALPLRGIRSFDAFALLVAGVAPPPQTVGANGPGIGVGVGTAGQFSVNGQRARANNFTIDGSDNNDQDVGARRQGFTPVIPQPIESIREFEISTLLADAEAGRNIGAQVNVITRSGTNQLHGQIYDFFNDSALNARDFFDLTIPGGNADGKSDFTRNQVGGLFSAPILENRGSIFAAYERQDLNRSQLTNFAVPSGIERRSAIALGNKVGSASGPSIFSLYPLPNNPGGAYGANTFTMPLPADGKGNIFTIKADNQFNIFGHLNTVAARYNFTDDNTLIPAVDNALNSSIQARTRTGNFALTLNTEIARGRLNQFRFSYGRTALGFDQVAGSPLLFQAPPVITTNGFQSPTGPIGRLLLSPFSAIGIDPFTFPQQRANNTFQIADTFIINSGKNSFKFGVDARRVQFNSNLERNYRAQIVYSSNRIETRQGPFIGSGADFAAMGFPSDISQALAITPDATLGLRFIEMNLFANANLRINSRLTIDLGLRYELNTVPTDVNNRVEKALALTPGDISNGKDDDQTAAFLATLKAQQDFVAGREKIYQGDHNNFAPRIGIAFDLTGDGRTSLRAGYGIFYDQILGNIVSQSRNIFPAFIPVDFGADILDADRLGFNPAFLKVFSPSNKRGTPLIAPGTVNTINAPVQQIAPFLGNFLIDQTLSFGFTLPDKNLRTPYAQQYALALTRAIGKDYVVSINYVGSLAIKLLRNTTPNGGPLTPLVGSAIAEGGVTSQARTRPIPELGYITVFESSANSNYNSLQATFARRSANGLGFQLAYTYSHAIDDVSDLFDTAGGYALGQDEIGLQGGLRDERASASFDARHRFTAGWSYDLPFAKRQRWLAGLRLSGILTLQTGQPYTVNSRLDVNRDGNLTDRLNTINGLIFSDGLTRISIAPGKSEADFLAILDSTNGVVGRNTFRAAGIGSLDLALDKQFLINESHRLLFRVEAFNIFNRVNFGIPVRIIGAPGFGSSVNTTIPARMVQMAIRYQF
jgi:hypothetical protein